MRRLWALVVALALVGPATAAPTVTVLEPITLHGRVEGDVVALAANVRVAADAEVRGDVVAVLGRIELEPGARIVGRALEVRSLAGLAVTDVRRAGRLPVVGTALLAVGLWLAVVGAAALALPRPVAVAAARVGVGGGAAAALGALSVTTLFAALLAALGTGPLAVPAVAALVVVALAVKAAGLAALGTALARRALPRAPVPLAAGAGAAALLAIRVVPVVGAFAWTAVSVAAFGAGAMVVAAAWAPRRLHDTAVAAPRR